MCGSAIQAMRAALALTLGAALAAAAPPPLQVEAEAARLLADTHTERIDFYALKTRLGPQAFKAVKSQLEKRFPETAEAGPSSPSIRTLLNSKRGVLFAGLVLAAEEKSREGYEADKRAASRMLEEFQALHDRLWSGEPASENYRFVAKLIGLKRTAKDPQLAELYTRVADDQFLRIGPINDAHDPASPNGASLAEAYAQRRVGGAAYDHDLADTAWLKQEIAAHGWFVISRYGEDADRAAWLLVQHADADPAFQRQVLVLLDGLRVRGESLPQRYAYLWDRVAVAEHRPQRYGTQGECIAGQGWRPDETEDVAGLDARRASVGLPTEADYRAGFKGLCG